MNCRARNRLDDDLPSILRRVVGRGILTLTILIVAGCSKPPSSDQAASQTSGNDWPGFLGPARNGRSAEKGVPEHWPAKPPAILWHKEIGVGYSAPAISQGRLFHFA